MLRGIEHFLRQLSWLPGLGWLDTWLASMYSQAGQYDQIKGDMELKAQEMSRVASDPFGTKGYTDDGEEATSESGEDGSGDSQESASKSKASDPKKPGAGGAASESSGGVPPQYRAQKIALRASCLMFVFLFVLVVTVWTVFFFDPKNVPWRHSMSYWRIGLQVVLMIAIPIVLNRIIRIWLEGARARYPDIQYAWEYGLRACQVAGIPLDSVPLYLIIGSENERLEMAVQAAAKLEYRVAGLPVGPAALHWYVTPDAVYLYATEVGWTSALATPLGPGEQATNAETPVLGLSDGIANSQRLANPSDAGQDVEGTVMFDQWEADTGFRIPDASGETPSQEFGSTQQFERTLTNTDGGTNAEVTVAASLANRESVPSSRSLSSEESTVELARLRYVARLLRNVRSPLCPLNGIVVMVPHQLLDGASDTVAETQKAVSADLAVIQEATQLRCPVTTLITGMEKEGGFCEFIRRVGPKRALWQRFGKKFDLATKRTEAELQGFNVHLIGAFEDWIYTLFREEDVLTKPGNTGLYELLGNVRCFWKSKLERFLTQVFANSNDQPLFSGCYFAATGPTPDRQAFVRAVFDKLTEEQELLEWTPRAGKEDRRLRVLSMLGYLCAIAGGLALIYRVGQLTQYW